MSSVASRIAGFAGRRFAGYKRDLPANMLFASLIGTGFYLGGCVYYKQKPEPLELLVSQILITPLGAVPSCILIPTLVYNVFKLPSTINDIERENILKDMTILVSLDERLDERQYKKLENKYLNKEEKTNKL
jgi:hypothetical protein